MEKHPTLTVFEQSHCFTEMVFVFGGKVDA